MSDPIYEESDFQLRGYEDGEGSVGEADLSRLSIVQNRVRSTTTIPQAFTNAQSNVNFTTTRTGKSVAQGWQLQPNGLWLCTEDGEYDIDWSGSYSGSSDSGVFVARAFVLLGPEFEIQLADSLQNYVEINGVGDRSGGLSRIAVTRDFNAGDQLRIAGQNTNAFGVTLEDNSLKIDGRPTIQVAPEVTDTPPVDGDGGPRGRGDLPPDAN